MHAASVVQQVTTPECYTVGRYVDAASSRLEDPVRSRTSQFQTLKDVIFSVGPESRFPPTPVPSDPHSMIRSIHPQNRRSKWSGCKTLCMCCMVCSTSKQYRRGLVVEYCCVSPALDERVLLRVLNTHTLRTTPRSFCLSFGPPLVCTRRGDAE